MCEYVNINEILLDDYLEFKNIIDAIICNIEINMYSNYLFKKKITILKFFICCLLFVYENSRRMS